MSLISQRMVHWWRINGSTARKPFLQPPSRRLDRPVFDMTRPGIEPHLPALVARAQPTVSRNWCKKKILAIQWSLNLWKTKSQTEGMHFPLSQGNEYWQFLSHSSSLNSQWSIPSHRYSTGKKHFFCEEFHLLLQTTPERKKCVCQISQESYR